MLREAGEAFLSADSVAVFAAVAGAETLTVAAEAEEEEEQRQR